MNIAQTVPVSQHTTCVAVVIPVFRHSALFMEALESVASAAHNGEAHVIIVDDGCPEFQTAFSGIAARGKGFHYLRQINKGLSGARNAGIDFVISSLPECEAIYFLDADNRLSSHSFERFRQVLRERKTIDWFYPDIRMFGISTHVDYSGPFRPVSETIMNICEAGSLVRRRVFEDGARFDEKMKSGYEDWEFWISLVERGFLGEHLPDSGFCYRKRAESMLAESSRRHAEIIEYIETKHSWLRDISTIVQMEHVDAPRFAVITAESGEVLMGSDPAALRTCSRLEYSDILHQSLAYPNHVGAGFIIVFTSHTALINLAKVRLLRNIFTVAEIALERQPYLQACLEQASNDHISVEWSAQANGPCDFVFLAAPQLRKLLLDSNESWIGSLRDLVFSRSSKSLTIFAPELSQTPLQYRDQFEAVISFIKRERQAEPVAPWSAKLGFQEGTPDLSLLAKRLRSKYRNGVLPCELRPEKPRAIFVLPIMEFGGVEKVTFQVAREFAARGYSVDLLLYGAKRLVRYEELYDVFTNIYVFDHLTMQWEGAVFDTTVLPSSNSAQNPEVTNLLSTYDVVMCCNAAPILHDFADIRRLGVVTVNYIHLFEYADNGRAYGTPTIALAFEHCSDFIVTCSHQLAHQMKGLGTPRSRIIAVPNGPGLTIPPREISGSIEDRSHRSGPLRVLYFGRLDAQKGLDRLAEIVSSLSEQPQLVEVRVVGGKVLGGDAGELESRIAIEAPLFDSDRIIELYRWADVLIMPSRFEGLPLAIIEAMSLGCIAIATDVGAVHEVISPGKDGYLISSEPVAEQMLQIIWSLAEDRGKLAKLSANAVASAKKRNWTAATEELFAKIDGLRKTRGAMRKVKPKRR